MFPGLMRFPGCGSHSPKTGNIPDNWVKLVARLLPFIFTLHGQIQAGTRHPKPRTGLPNILSQSSLSLLPVHFQPPWRQNSQNHFWGPVIFGEICTNHKGGAELVLLLNLKVESSVTTLQPLGDLEGQRKPRLTLLKL